MGIEIASADIGGVTFVDFRLNGENFRQFQGRGEAWRERSGKPIDEQTIRTLREIDREMRRDPPLETLQ
jgi:hypothetical protein